MHKLCCMTWLLALLTLTSTSALSAELTARVWVNDTQAFNNQVLDALSEELKNKDCIEETDIYVEKLNQKLRQLKGNIDGKSYLILRETILAVAENLGPVEEKISCAVLDRWAFIRAYIQNEIELVGNVILVLE